MKQGPTLNKSLSCSGCYSAYYKTNKLIILVNNFSKVSWNII